ncbi:MAG: exodeoxyribonuclease VII large subunit, partial [Opitutae bacterium]
MPDSLPLTVSDLTDVIKGHVNGLGTVEVVGEISGYKTYPSGHHYFSLKDAEAKVECILYGFQARWIKFQIKDGLRVVVKAKVDFYGKSGKLSLVIDSMKPEGEGELQKKYLELLAKLKAEGLFEEEIKRPIPTFPKVVAFVTSEIGAVWHDFTEVLKTRGWRGTVWLVPARVQGESCAGSVLQGLKLANEI